jgi:chorismate mutase / prephenate dehydratase
MSSPAPAESPTVAYMGPPGTFSHLATRSLFPDNRTLECPTIADVIDRVARREAELGVVPVENSTEGGVTATLDGLLDTSLSICREIVVDVSLCLVARTADRGRFRRVASHPQPLAQCRRWLSRELPGVALFPTPSTAAAAREAATDEATAAVTSRLAAELENLLVVAEDIQDRPENATRFAVIGQTDAAPTGRDKTSLVFSTPHERGALRRVLGVFDDAGINLTRIESRPQAGKRWEYVFFTDIEGHRTDVNVADALRALSELGGAVRVLGSYPRAV